MKRKNCVTFSILFLTGISSITLITLLCPVFLSAVSIDNTNDNAKDNPKDRISDCFSACEVHDLSIDEAEDYALEFNYSVKALEHIAKSGQYAYYQAITGWLPQGNLTADTSRSDLGLTFNRARVYNTVIAFEEVLFDPKVYYGITISASEAKKLRAQLNTLKNQVLFDTRVAYYRLLLSLELLKVEEDNIRNLTGGFNRDYQMLEFGESTQFDASQSETAVANAYTNYYRAVNAIETARNGLLEVMGYPPLDIVGLSVKQLSIDDFPLLIAKVNGMNEVTKPVLEEIKENQPHIQMLRTPNIAIKAFDPCVVMEWTRMALLYRPEVIESCCDKEIAYRTLQSRYGDYLPSARVFGGPNMSLTKGVSSKYDIDGKRITDAKGNPVAVKPVVQRLNYWNYGISANWQIFDSFGRYQGVMEAKERYRASCQYLQGILLQTEHDISNIFHNLENLLRVYDTSRQGVTIANQSFLLADEASQLGEIRGIEYRESVNDLTQARRDYNGAIFNLIAQYYELLRTAGTPYGVCDKLGEKIVDLKEGKKRGL